MLNLRFKIKNMSNKILKMGLDLFKDDLQSDDLPKKKKKTVADPKNFISTNKRGVRKELQKLSKKQHREKLAKQHARKTAHEELRRYQQKDNTEASVSFLDRLSRLDSTESSTVKRIVQHTKGRLAKDQQSTKDIQKSSSIFSDRDFEKFQEEYDWWDS